MDIKKLKTAIISGIVLISLTSTIALKPEQDEVKVRIQTTKGDIVVKLYNETPQTRDNFLKLSKNQNFFLLRGDLLANFL